MELVQYLNPHGGNIAPTNRNDVGACHLGIVVDDLEAIYQDVSAKGANFLSPPVQWESSILAHKVAYMQGPDGNWPELLEGSPVLRFA